MAKSSKKNIPMAKSSKKEKYEYRINPAAARRGGAYTFIDKEYVNLAGESSEIERPESKKGPARKRKIRGATQKDLKRYFEETEKNGGTQKLVTKHLIESDEVEDETADDDNTTDGSSDT